MKTRLKILIIEDSKEDTELLVQALSRSGYELTYERVDCAEGTRAALSREKWDAVISDYVLPFFSGLDALQIVLETEPDMPFIIVSGKIGEEVAVEALQAGAHDYLLKDKLGRLSSAVRRALEDAGARKRKRQAEQQLKDSEERYRRLVETSPVAMAIFCEERISYVNPAGVKMFGADTPVELIGRPVTDIIPVDLRKSFLQRLRDIALNDFTPTFQQKMIGLDAKSLFVDVVGRPISYHGDKGIQIIFREIADQIAPNEKASPKVDFFELPGPGLTPEFSSIFTVILGYAGLARARLNASDPALQDLKQVIAAAERGLNLTRAVRTVAQNRVSHPDARLLVERTSLSQPLAAPSPAFAMPLKPSILVVEDEQVLRELTELILVKSGFTVFVAKDSDEALKIADGRDIAVLFTDVVIPKLSGPELAKKLLQNHPDMSVLYTSGYPESVISEYGVPNQSEFLAKPYTLQNLVERITGLVKEKAQRQ